MSKTLFEQIEEVVNKYNSYPTLDTVTTTVYKNKLDETEVITEADFIIAFKAGKSITDYEPITETVNPKEELKALIFGEREYSSYAALGQFIKVCAFASGIKLGVSGESSAKETKPTTKPKSDFNKAIAAINAKIHNAKTKGTEEKLGKLKLERVQLYIKAGVAPLKSFKDIELYNTELEKAKKA